MQELTIASEHLTQCLYASVVRYCAVHHSFLVRDSRVLRQA